MLGKNLDQKILFPPTSISHCDKEPKFHVYYINETIIEEKKLKGMKLKKKYLVVLLVVEVHRKILISGMYGNHRISVVIIIFECFYHLIKI